MSSLVFKELTRYLRSNELNPFATFDHICVRFMNFFYIQKLQNFVLFLFYVITKRLSYNRAKNTNQNFWHEFSISDLKGNSCNAYFGCSSAKESFLVLNKKYCISIWGEPLKVTRNKTEGTGYKIR